MKTMKSLFLLALAMAATTAAVASPLSTETPIRSVGTPVTVSVATATWTKVTTTSGQTGYIVSTSSATSYMAGHLGNCTSTSIATTVRPFSFVPGAFTLIPVADNICLWTLNLGASAENMHVQGIKQ